MPRRKKSKLKEPDHLHRYERVILGKSYEVMRCNLPNCMHYIAKRLAKNKISICNRCNNPFVMDSAALLLAKPHCKDCTVSKDKDQIAALTELFR